MNEEVRKRIEEIPTNELFDIFEQAIRTDLLYRDPNADLNRLIQDIRRKTSRELLLQLAYLLPHIRASTQANSGLGSSEQSNNQIKYPPPHEHGQEGLVGPNLLKNETPSAEDRATSSFKEGRTVDSHLGGRLTIPHDKCVMRGLYIMGCKSDLTRQREFVVDKDYSMGDRGALDHNVFPVRYHFKIVQTADVHDRMQKLESVGVIKPILPPPSEDENEAEGNMSRYSQEKEQYEEIVAQTISSLPTVWPAADDCIVGLNEVEFFDGREVPREDHVDLTQLVRQGNNQLTIIFLSDLDRFCFCLFEKRVSDTGGICNP